MGTLFAAAIAGDADARKKLEMKADIVVGYREYTILHTESLNGKAEHVRFILWVFANKNVLVKLSKFKESALCLAAGNGHTEVAEVLIDAARNLPSSSANTHINPVTSLQAFLRQADIIHSDTALHVAVAGGYFNIVKLLLEADPSDQHSQNNQGKTPIYIAAEKGYTEIVKLICTTCAAPSLDGPRGSTALHAPIMNLDNGTEVVEVLIDAVRLLSSFSFQTFLRKGDEDLNTALHIAVMEGNVAIVKLLLEADPADRPIQNKKGETPIYIAAEKGYTEIVKLICTTCTTLSELTADWHGTALHAAIKNLDDSRIEVFEVLIAAARLLSSSSYSFQDFLGEGDEDSNTAIHIAVIEGNVGIVKLLLEADPNHRYHANKEGKTPMYIAAEKGYNEIVKVICTTCTAPISLDGPGDSTALHAAILNIDEGVVP